jgi:hypothetical protein
MKRPRVIIEYWNYKLVVPNDSIACDGTGWGDTFKKLGKSCVNCPIRFKCFSTNVLL